MKKVLKYLSAALYNLRNRRVVSLAKEYSARQWWPTEKLHRLGDQRVRSLAIHSSKNVPYYRQVFHSLGIDPTQNSFSEDWNRLPILEKETLRTQYNELIAETEHSKKARENHSGGSTGKPVAFLSDLAIYEMMEANMRLIFSWAGWKPGELILHLWGGKGKKLPLTFMDSIKTMFSGNLVLPVYSFDGNVFKQWWEVLKAYQPTIIYAYPSVVAQFSRWLKEKGYEPSGVKGIFCSAETLFLTHRKIIEEVFGCKVYNQYGSRETPCVACECPEGNMHIFIDLNRVEFLDQAEDPEGPRRIIVTPLENYAQPLLRYDLGDLGIPKKGICPCGRGYPLMEVNLGRKNDHIRTSNGKLIYPSYFIHLLDGIKGIVNFQFKQVSLSKIDLYLLENKKEGVNRDQLKEVEDKIKKDLSPNILLNINFVDEIPLTSAGKHRFVISDIPG